MSGKLCNECEHFEIYVDRTGMCVQGYCLKFREDLEVDDVDDDGKVYYTPLFNDCFVGDWKCLF